MFTCSPLFLIPQGGGGGPAAIPFNTANAPANITFSNNDFTIQKVATGAAAACAQTTTGRTTGKRVFEIFADLRDSGACAAGIEPLFGVASADATTDLGQETNEFGYRAEGASYFSGSYNGSFGPTWTTNDTIMVCVDFDAKKIWFRKNGVNVSGDPETGTGGQSYSYSGDMFPTAQVNVTSKLTIRTSAAQIVGTIPTGFSAYAS